MTRNGTPMQRLRDRTRVSVAPERIQYLAERGLEQSVEQVGGLAEDAAADAAGAVAAAGTALTAANAADGRIDDVLSGVEDFSALQVDGQDVSTFLGRTDGSAIDDAAALPASVVGPGAIGSLSATAPIALDGFGAITWTGTTSNVPEGSNLYHTSERVDDRVAVLIQNGTGISWSYNDGANTLTPTVSLSIFSTSNLAEGTNLYHTTARARGAISAAAGPLSYNPSTGTYKRGAMAWGHGPEGWALRNGRPSRKNGCRCGPQRNVR